MKGTTLSYDMYDSTIYKKLKKTMDIIQDEERIKAQKLWQQVGQVNTPNFNHKDSSMSDQNTSRHPVLNVFADDNIIQR